MFKIINFFGNVALAANFLAHINIICFVCGAVDYCIAVQDTEVNPGQHLTYKIYKVPPSAHSSVSVSVECLSHDLIAFSFPLIHWCCFFLPFRIGMGHPWNCQASSCLISSVKFKLPSNLHTYTYTTWLRICGISVNVRISERGKEISVCFESINTHDEIRPPDRVLWESAYEQPSSSSHQGFCSQYSIFVLEVVSLKHSAVWWW